MSGLSKRVQADFFSTFFMFPFSYDVKRLSGMQLSSYFIKKGWIEKDYCMDKGIDYNEFVYFYPYIRDILMRECERDYEHFGVRFLEFDFGNHCMKYTVENWQSPEDKKAGIITAVSLPLKNVFLHLFDTGVGILIFEIVDDLRDSRETRSIYDYLFFVGQGRRVYPPFINWKAKLNKEKFKCAFDDGDAISAKECPLQIKIHDESYLVCQEDFVHNFSLAKDSKENKFKPFLSNIIRYFLDMDDFCYQNDSYSPVIDDRMFSHTLYSIPGDGHPVNRLFLTKMTENLDKSPLEMTINDAMQLWYQMIFVDIDGPTCKNDLMMKRLISESTYPRWSQYGSVYGFSRFSSAFVIDVNQAYYIYNHFQTMYYQIAVLQLFYRGSFLSFSKQSAMIAQEINRQADKHKNIIKVFGQLDKLYQDYVFFRNKYWFKEVTAQDQGIEIYDLWSSRMRNKELMEDIYTEINGLYMLMDAKVEKETKATLDNLQLIGQFALPIIITAGIFSMNKDVLGYLNGHIFNMSPLCWFLIFMILIGIMIYLMDFGMKYKRIRMSSGK